MAPQQTTSRAPAAAPLGDGIRREVGASDDAGGVRTLLRDRRFRTFWLGALISNLGTWMQNVAVPYALLQITGQARWVGLAAVAHFAPSVIAGPLGGALADRANRTRFLLFSQIAQVTVAAAMWLSWVGGMRSPWMLIALVTINATIYGGTVPCNQAYVGELVPPRLLVSAITLNSAQLNVARAVGPGLAGVVLATWGAGATFLVNAVSYSALIIALLVIRDVPRTRALTDGNLLAALREGVTTALSTPAIRVALAVSITTAALISHFSQFLAVFADDLTGGAPGWYGAMAAAYGLGAAAGAVSLAVAGPRVRPSAILRWSLLAFGVLVLVFAQIRSPWLALPLLAFIGASFVNVFSVLNTAVQHATPSQVRARVLSVYIGSHMVVVPLGAWLLGIAIDRYGVQASLTTAAGCYLATVVTVIGRQRLLRRLDP